MITFKKTIPYFILIFSVSSCNSYDAPKCGEQEVKNIVIKLFNEQMKQKLKDEYLAENFNWYDAIEYAKNKGWDEHDYAENQKQKIMLEAEKYAEEITLKTDLKNIRSNSIEENIKLCNCSAEILNNDLKKMEVDYTAQRTEDKNKSIYVELNYTVK